MDSSWLPILVIALFLGWFLVRTQLGKVAPARAKELVQRGATLLDVRCVLSDPDQAPGAPSERTPAEFASGHIEGAQNVPLGSLGSAIGRLKGPVVVHCQSGMRSASAGARARRAGLEVGAMGRWR